MNKTVLVVPGFRPDTYSQIEDSFIELSVSSKNTIKFLWLVPSLDSKYLRFKNADLKGKLREPVYVKKLKEQNIDFIEKNLSKFNVVKNILIFKKIFDVHEIDAVYTHFGFERFYAAICARLFKKKIIWTEHWQSTRTKYGGVKSIFYQIFVDNFIAVSDFISSTLPTGKNKYICKPSIELADIEEVEEKTISELRKKLGIDKGNKVALMVAAFSPIKHHDLAFKACTKIISLTNNVIFVFVGDGERKDHFVQMVRKEGLAHRIKIVGHVIDVKTYYMIADVCFLTSINEAFGLTLLEALMYRKPFVAFKSGGIQEVITDRKTGILVDEADWNGLATKILDILRSPDEYRSMIETAYHMVYENYGREKWILNMKNIMAEILSK